MTVKERQNSHFMIKGRTTEKNLREKDFINFLIFTSHWPPPYCRNLHTLTFCICHSFLLEMSPFLYLSKGWKPRTKPWPNKQGNWEWEWWLKNCVIFFLLCIPWTVACRILHIKLVLPNEQRDVPIWIVIHPSFSWAFKAFGR